MVKWTSSLALMWAAGLMVVNPAASQAADLGGDCCADLEERIAELEATTARKGNRKVSLEVSGQVNEALLFWDDGYESNVYQVTNDNSRTRFRFKGKAKISADLSAGYLLEIGVRSANSKRVNQIDDDVDGGTLDLRHSAWFLKSKSLGTVWVGQSNTATQDITEINLTQTKSVAKYSDVEDSGLGMFLRTPGTGDLSNIQWYRLIGGGGDQPGEGDRQNVVRYVTPEFAGFSASAAWGEDDFWDVALEYAGEFAGFKLAAGIGYGQIRESGGSDQIGVTCPAADDLHSHDADCHQIGGSVSVVHVNSGLFVNFAAGQLVDDQIEDDVRFAGLADDETTFYSVQAGIERKWSPLGKTTLWGEYYNHEGGSQGNRDFSSISSTGSELLQSSELQMYGLGIAQGIDAAAMTLYVFYRHFEADAVTQEIDTVNLTDDSYEDLDIVMGGAIIKF